MNAIRDSIRSNVDRPLVIIYLLLLFAGWANIYSAAYNPDHPNLFDTKMEYGNQSVWIVVCLILGSALLMVRGDFIKDMALPVYGMVLLLLALVPVLGKEVGGNTNWLQIGPIRIQPSEFAKFATALVLTRYLSGLKSFSGFQTRMVATLIILLLAIGVLILAILSLIMRETLFHIPFWGKPLGGQYFLIGLITVVCLLSFYVVSRFVMKRQRKRLYGFIAFTLIGSAVFISGFDFVFQNLLSERHRTRINVTLGLLDDPQGLGYNAAQSKTAIGSGGFLGKGYLDGTFTKYKYVPEQQTDFIFCTVGEEWGFVGTTVIVLLFGALILRCIQIGERQRSRFTRIYAYCAASIFFLHLMINVGMAIGLAPVIGIPLPLFSYGGSSLIGFTLLLGILVRLDAERLSQLR